MRKLLLIMSASLMLASPAFALNPQPLPPGLRSPYAPRYAMPQTIQRAGGGHRSPVCHAVQPGDPRTQPPMLVCH